MGTVVCIPSKDAILQKETITNTKANRTSLCQYSDSLGHFNGYEMENVLSLLPPVKDHNRRMKKKPTVGFADSVEEHFIFEKDDSDQIAASEGDSLTLTFENISSQSNLKFNFCHYGSPSEIKRALDIQETAAADRSICHGDNTRNKKSSAAVLWPRTEDATCLN